MNCLVNGANSCNSPDMNNKKKEIKDFGDLLFDVMPKQLEPMKDKAKRTKPPPPPDLRRKWHKDCRVKHYIRKMPKPGDKLIFYSGMRDFYENREHPPIYSYLPNFAVKVAKLLYYEQLRTLPLLEHPEMVSDLLNYDKLLHKAEKLQNLLCKKFIGKMNEDNNQAEMKAKQWFRHKLRRFYEKLVPYTEITDWLIDRLKKKHDRKLKIYKFKARKELETLTQIKLMRDLQDVEEDFRMERIIKLQKSIDDQHNTLELFELKYLDSYYKKFNKLQQTKLKTALRVTTLLEIEHNQQIIDHARIQFQLFNEKHKLKSMESAKLFAQTKRQAQILSEEIIDKIELNRNLHERINTCKSMTKEVIQQAVNLINYFIREKDKDVEPFPHLDKKSIRKILKLVYVCIPTDTSTIDTEMVSCISAMERKKCLLKFLTGESDLEYIINEGTDPMSEIDSIVDTVINRVILITEKLKTKSKILSTSPSGDFDIFDEELLIDDALHKKREQEIFFKLVDESLKVPSGGERLEFATKSLKVIATILNRDKAVMNALFEKD